MNSDSYGEAETYPTTLKTWAKLHNDKERASRTLAKYPESGKVRQHIERLGKLVDVYVSGYETDKTGELYLRYSFTKMGRKFLIRI